MEHISRLKICLCAYIKRKQNAPSSSLNFGEINKNGQYSNAFLVAYISLVSDCKITIFFRYNKIFFLTPLFGTSLQTNFQRHFSDAARHVSTSLQNKIPVSVETICTVETMYTSSLHTAELFFQPTYFFLSCNVIIYSNIEIITKNLYPCKT